MDFDTIIQKIMERASSSKEEVMKRILEKQKEVSNLVSKEGAAYIIAKEIGLDLFPKTKRRLEIKNVVPKIRNLNLNARVIKVFEPTEFKRKDGKGKVANIILGDNTGTIRLALWDDQTDIVNSIKPGMAVETFGAYTKENEMGGVEIRLGKTGGLKILEQTDLPELEKLSGSRALRTAIPDLKEGNLYEIRAALVQLFETNLFFEICPNCGSKVEKVNNLYKCKTHGDIEPTYSLVLSGVIDDAYGNMRAVFFRNAALQLIKMNIEEALEKKDSLLDDLDVLGKEFIFSGRVRKNKMFNRLEFVVNAVREVDILSEVNKLINSLVVNV